MRESDDSWRIRLYQKGLKDNQIAERMGISPRTICDWRRKNGLLRNTEPGGQIKKFPEREKLYKEGLNDREVAGRLGKSPSTICSWRKKRSFLANTNPGGQFYQIPLTPTKELGYFCGLVIGDGWIYRQKSRNYTIGIESTKKNIINQFRRSAIKLGLNPSRVYSHLKTRKFPNGEIRTDRMYMTIANSKILYDALRPYKQKNSYWGIPKFLTTEESLFGFLGGIFDAEGSRLTTGLTIASKQKENLIELKKLLQRLGFIYGTVSIGEGELSIYGLGNIRLFLEKAELHLKKEKVQSLLENRPRYHPREQYEEVMRLRKENKLGGRRISKITSIPVSTIEDWIYKGKKPWELKVYT